MDRPGPPMESNVAIERFVAACREANAVGPQEVRQLVERTIADRGDLRAALGLPDAPGLHTILRADDLTVLHVVWAPRMEAPPHDHRMWAVIGVYAGREVNRFWRRDTSGLQSAGTRTLHAGEVVLLGADVIHSVANPLDRSTGAIHVYGGDFFAAERSEWANEHASEERFDPQRAVQRFNRTGGSSKS